MTELVDLLERGLNRKAKRNLIPMPATGDVLATFADISAAKAVRLTLADLAAESDIPNVPRRGLQLHSAGHGHDRSLMAASISLNT